MTLEYEHIPTQEGVRRHIRDCEGKHTQQAVYSTFHDAFTQICFGCRKIRTNIRMEKLMAKQQENFEEEVEGAFLLIDWVGVHTDNNYGSVGDTQAAILSAHRRSVLEIVERIERRLDADMKSERGMSGTLLEIAKIKSELGGSGG